MMATKPARPQRSHIRPSYRQTGDDPEWRILGAVLKRAIFDARSRHVRAADREEALTFLIEEGSEWLQYLAGVSPRTSREFIREMR